MTTKEVGSLARRIARKLIDLLRNIICTIPIFRCIKETAGTQTPIQFKHFLWQKVFGFNRSVYWPAHFTSIISGVKNIYCGIETSPGYMPGCYIQAIGKIFIGDYTQISANVGIISANHDLHDNRNHIASFVSIGKYCWIGMNSMILPGVKLGDFTIVGAGSVVTKSFEGGYCVIAGNPARLMKTIDPAKCVFHKSEVEYNGYIRSTIFEKFRREKLDV